MFELERCANCDCQIAYGVEPGSEYVRPAYWVSNYSLLYCDRCATNLLYEKEPADSDDPDEDFDEDFSVS